MELFADPLSFPAYAAVFAEGGEIVSERRFSADGRESEHLMEELDATLAAAGTSWEKLGGIYLVNGPGGFTGTRLSSLLANAVGWALGTPLHAVDAFALLDLAGAPYPRFARANRTEYLVRAEPGSGSVLAKAADLPAGIYAGPGNPLDFDPGRVIISGTDYASALKRLETLPPEKRIVPSYAKAPNIS